MNTDHARQSPMGIVVCSNYNVVQEHAEACEVLACKYEAQAERTDDERVLQRAYKELDLARCLQL